MSNGIEYRYVRLADDEGRFELVKVHADLDVEAAIRQAAAEWQQEDPAEDGDWFDEVTSRFCRNTRSEMLPGSDLVRIQQLVHP